MDETMKKAKTTANRPQGAAPHGPVLVSGAQLATHFGVVRTRIDQLALQGIFSRRPDGNYDQDECRLKYLGHLRAENRKSPVAAANAEHAKAKTEMLAIKIAQQRGELVPLAE
jgi:hypothetical protein